MSPTLESLANLARTSLKANLEPIGDGLYLTAGRRQFRCLWTRDFCFAAPGLVALGRDDVVGRQLGLILSHLRERDGLVPRSLDSVGATYRAAVPAVRRVLRWWPAPRGIDPKRLRAEHTDQYGSVAIDGNALVLRTWLAWRERQRLAPDAETRRVAERLLGFYDSYVDDELLVQPAFSDWQDSVRRRGATFYVNLLYYVARRDLVRLGLVDATKLARQREAIDAAFFDTDVGLFRSVRGAEPISLDGNLLALAWGYFADATERAASLYAALRRHALWRAGFGIPGSVTMPDYPRRERSLVTQVVGLGHYHDRLVWSWLVALAARVAAEMGEADEAHRILSRLAELAERDGGVAEIYDRTPDLRRWSSWLYRAELPFAWGAAMTLETLDAIAGDRRATA